MAYETPEYHPAFEEYSETIYELGEDGIEVIQARIAERLDVSRPAVSEMVGRMQREGLVAVDGGGVISLTDTGSQIALTVVRRHRLAERILTDVLGLDWAAAHREAGRWEHVISPVVEQAMLDVLDDPTTCPHGNPIPGSDYVAPAGAVSMSGLTVGDRFIVERISEALEWAPGQLAYLEQIGVMPTMGGRLIAASPDGTLTVEVGEQIAAISATAADQVTVSRLT